MKAPNRSQEALKESELRYREIFEYSSEGIFLLDVTSDRRFQITGFNPAEEKAVGLLGADVAGKFVDDVFPEAVATQVIAKYRRCVETGMPMSYDEELDLPIGRRFFQTVLVPVRNSAGRVYRIVGFAHDVTEHKRAESLREAAYRISEAAQGAGSLHDFFRQAHEIVSTLVPARNFYVALVDPETGMLEFPYFVDEVDPPPAPRPRGRTLTDYVIRTGEPLLASREVFDDLVSSGEVEPVGAPSIDWLGVALKTPGGTIGAAVVQTYTAGVRFSDSDRDLLTFISGQLAMAVQRKRAGEALRGSEERYRQIVETTTEGICSIDAKFRITFANSAFARMLGCTSEELIGAPTERYTFPAELGESRGHLDARRLGVPEQYERRLRRKDGKEYWCLVSGAPILDSEGRFAGSFGMFTDITERKRAEKEMRKSEERFRRLFNSNTIGISVGDLTGRVLEGNDAYLTMLGYTREELLSGAVRWDEMTPTEYREKDQIANGQLQKTGIAQLFEKEMIRKDGTRVPLLMGIATLEASEGSIIAYTVDLSARRILEEQLRQSQKMEAVGRLAGGVAHDFNNLLTVMLGYSDVLLTGLELGPLHEAAQEIRRAGERAAALTRQLLAFSRKQTLVPEVLDLGDVVSALSTMVERLIGEEVKVSVVVSPGLGRVKADRGQLEQVVMNLAVNARDAMPKGGSLIFELQNVELDDAYAATHAEVKPGPYVLLAISDTGTGMDAETQKRVFEPFFTTKETGKGTGLGLSTVHGIVHQSGGSIDVYSEPGQGTTFKVYLPRFTGDAAVRRPVSGDHPALAAESETVLVVEDEAAIRQLTNLILQRAGYTVLLAEGPVAAERIAGSHPGPIHLVLTDVVMPGMRGPELAERLLRSRPDLRVLYMSGYTDDAISHHGMLDPGTEFLQKPFTPLRLTQKIREVLGRSRR